MIGTAQRWIASYLSGRKQRILIENNTSEAFNINLGVPQGSCLGPILFILYVAGLFKIIERHLPNAHSYEDDSEIYLSFRPDSCASQVTALACIENCVADVRSWMLANHLLISDNKTEFIIIGSRQQMAKIKLKKLH